MADKKRVLVVDDDETIMELAVSVLSMKYEVKEAVDGQDGLEKALSWKPDLVVTDLMMPRMHGYELCTRLKGPEGVPGVKILVLSAKSFATDKSQAMAAGADDYVVKPFDVMELLEKAQALIASEKQAAPAKAKSTEIFAASQSVPEPERRSGLPVYLRFWGTRGSSPTSGMPTVRYGGNTACTELRIGDVPIIIDCGSGLHELGCALAKEFAGKPLKGYIFVGHTHWDHIQGFPFFTPFYNPNNTFNVYSVCGAHTSLRSIFSESMALDYFPVPLSNLACKLSFVEMAGPVDIGVARFTFHHLNHPGPCIGFRIETQGRVITYISDHEDFRRLSGDNDTARRNDAAVEEFARGSDLLIKEAQYTEEEYATRKGWGHGTYDDAARFAIATGVRRMAIFHHDPDHNDDMLDANIEYCRAQLKKAGSATDCFAAKDGLRLDL